MANIILQNILKSKVLKLVEATGCKPHIGFMKILFKEMYGLDDLDIEEALVDGAGDGGIDALFEQNNENGETILYVVQSKFRDKNPDLPITEDDRNKTISAVTNYILNDYPIESLNQKIQKKIIDYRERLSNGMIDKVGIIFLTNGARSVPSIYEELDKFQLDNPAIFYEMYCEENLASIFSPPSSLGVKGIELKVIKDSGSGEKTTLNLPDAEALQGKICKVDLYELAQIVERNPGIFNSNIRVFQSINNPVNKEITKTLKNPDGIREFIYLNNGITILCDEMRIKAGGEVLELKNPSIINGCQTASTVFEVYKLGKIEKNIGFVLVRVIRSSDPGSKMKIILASNRQTAVRSRDLISEDDIQKQLEAEFLTLGYYYERKPRLYFDKPQDVVIDLEKAAQAYMALIIRKPAEAKNKKREIYGSYYDQIFNKQTSAKGLLVPYKLYEKISDKVNVLRKKEVKDDDKSLLGNSILHLLPLFNEWVLKPKGYTLLQFGADINLIAKIVDENIGKVISRLKKSIKKIQPENVQYFFKTSDSLDKILATPGGQPKYTLTLTSDNWQSYQDLRYYKPDNFRIDNDRSIKITHWNDLFVELVEKYAQHGNFSSTSLNFLGGGGRTLLSETPTDEERKLRKQLNGGLWLLTNFDSKTLATFCFGIIKKTGNTLAISLRPTLFRIKKKLSG